MPWSFFAIIMSFVTERRYFIQDNNLPQHLIGNELICINSNSGVPQGSHIGPLLFLLYARDITDSISGTGVQILQYADDIKIFGKVSTV